MEEPLYDEEDTATPITEDNLKKLSLLAAQAKEKKERVDTLEARLKAAKGELNQITERDIPEIMQDIDMLDFRLGDGTRIQIKEDVHCSVPVDRRPAVKDWMDEQGLGGMVRRTVTIEFTAEEEAWARKFEADMAKRKKPLRARIDFVIHPSTLKAWVKRRLDEGLSLPMDLFGVFIRKKAKVD